MKQEIGKCSCIFGIIDVYMQLQDIITGFGGIKPDLLICLHFHRPFRFICLTQITSCECQPAREERVELDLDQIPFPSSSFLSLDIQQIEVKSLLQCNACMSHRQQPPLYLLRYFCFHNTNCLHTPACKYLGWRNWILHYTRTCKLLDVLIL